MSSPGGISGGYGGGGAYGASGGYAGAHGASTTPVGTFWSYGFTEYGDSFSIGVHGGKISFFIDALLSVSDLINPGEYGTTEYGGGVVTPFSAIQKFTFFTIDALLDRRDTGGIHYLIGKLRNQITAPQVIRSRGKLLGPRESYRQNLAMAQLLYDLKKLFGRYDTFALELNSNIADIQTGFNLPSAFVYHNAPLRPVLILEEETIVVPGGSHHEELPETESILEGFILGTEELAIELEKLRDRIERLENGPHAPFVSVGPPQPIIVTGDEIVIG